jgi:hypothetical protein
MRSLLIFTLLLIYSLSYSQSGNTIAEAILTDGINIPLNILNFNTATASGQQPSCGSIVEDVFYAHQISPGDNKLTIELNTSLLTLLTTVEYQILMAPNGDTENLQEIECDSYFVLISIGGGFTKVIDNVDPLDDYYMRIKKRTDELINDTTITMTSENDPSLSINGVNNAQFKIIVNQNEIKLMGDQVYQIYEIYSIDGKQIIKNQSSSNLNMIDISNLSKGIYILNLKNNTDKHIIKFVKY